MKLQKAVGATSEIWQVFIQDTSSLVGAGLTGLAFNTSGLVAYYHRDTDTTVTTITLATMTVGTFTSSGFKEIDSVKMPGWYQFCPPNAALASGAKSCAFSLQGATNMAQLPIETQLIGVPIDLVGGAAGGVFIAGSNAATTVNFTGNLSGSIGSLGATAKTDVNTEVNNVVNVQTKSELSAVPAANASLGDKLCFMEMKIRNKETQDATTATINDTSGSPIGSSTVSDLAGTFTKGKYA